MKKFFILISFFITIFSEITAQEGQTVFNFMRFPSSARASALGGVNVSLIEPDLSLVFQNPGFLGPEMNKDLNLNHLFYIGDVSVGSAIFAKSLGDRSSWGIGVNYSTYGNMQETTEETVLGDLNANDICFNAFLSRDLTEKFRGGITAKFIYSSYDRYTATGLAFDLGLSYYDQDKDVSMGLVLKNVGTQLQAYHEEKGPLPWDIQFGVSKKLTHAPIRFSLTGHRLNEWDFYNVDGSKDKFLTSLAKHIIIGADFIPNNNFWLGIGYNVKQAEDLKLQEGNRLGGFSAGGGFRVKAFEINCAVAQFHPSATSFLISLTTSFGEFNH